MAQEENIYILPAGLLHGQAAQEAIAASCALPLAGEKRLAYTVACVFHRCAATGEISRRWMGVRALREAAERSEAIAAAVSALARRREMPAPLPEKPALIMGIVNVTPDSFSDGGRHAHAEAAVAHGRALAAAGADILDVGGESTRPGAKEVPVEKELARVIPVIERLAAEGFIVSVDTRKPEVMEAAVKAGAAIINDVAALHYAPDAATRAAQLNVPVVLMHSRGTPVDPDDPCTYEHVVLDVFDWLAAAKEQAVRAGVREENIILDPGIGFGKTCAQNLELIASLALFHQLGRPLLLGASRKRFIGAITDVEQADQRLAGSLAVAQEGLRQGVQIVRVHDVAETVQMARMIEALERQSC
ncbi:dihydropteroate synthase [Thermopetrobacter sp. TC1]|uniref:dihydropteroate synthase n=1 Tax=Thermopetrobacter sp. TC1 TaxID=1495045 RepID=UPI00068FD88B|nr:dihydropteroate synthase [Thermopetrobacter sp. TC1]